MLPGSLFVALCPLASAAPAPLPAPGEWDGVTASARLERPYEDPRQATIPFGLTSYFAHPWRSYMDTWPAQHYLESLGAAWNVAPKYGDALCQLLAESGIRQIRYEIGWGNFNWNNQLTGSKREEVMGNLQLFKRHGLRPLILLNSHHAAPCPYSNIWVEVVAEGKVGDRVLKLKDARAVTVGRTGPMHAAEYCAAKPLITAVDSDGMCQLSMPLPAAIPAGRLSLYVLKHEPLQGAVRKDGTVVTANEATLAGWREYVQHTADLAKEALGTQGQPDAGFDLEVWNELTFGSNFLNINNYYEPKLEFAAPLTHIKQRPFAPGLRPDARTEFKFTDFGILYAITVDFMRAHETAYPRVKVDNGFANQWPWDSGTQAYPGQDAFSRHYYLGNWRDISPTKHSRPDMATINALGVREGITPRQPKDWWHVEVGSTFIPTVRVGLPEWGYCGFQTENIARDVQPDSRVTGMDGHGRYTHNGDFRTVEVWQTEFNYGRQAFFDRFFEETKVAKDDPRAYALDNHITGKILLRMYTFQNHKGLRRLYVFAPGDGAYGINMMTPLFYRALDQSDGKLTPAVRATLPTAYQGLAWLKAQMETGEAITAPRPLRVDELIEYQPRLQYAGDGSPGRPHQWNRDWFAFLPYQLTPGRFIVPYYVVTIDVNRIWDARRDPFDPQRYDMPEQEYDVTIGNCAGSGAQVSVYDPLTNTDVPVKIVAARPDTLTVRLRTTDYPRVLTVTEAKPGPQILDPRVTADSAGKLTVAWQTNIKVDSAEVTYGADWMNRSAQSLQLKPVRSNRYAVTIPTGLTGVIAARIRVTANGLTAVWPRWDEDPAGQIVVPGSVAAVPAVKATPAAPAAATVPPTALIAPADVALPVRVTLDPRDVVFQLPAGAVLAGSGDNREARWGSGAKAVQLRVRYVPGGAKFIKDLLPVVAVGDVERCEPVTLPSGSKATLADYQFEPAAHPGMVNVWQRYLVVPVGAEDAVVLTASGSAAAGLAHDRLVTAIFASVGRRP